MSIHAGKVIHGGVGRREIRPQGVVARKYTESPGPEAQGLRFFATTSRAEAPHSTWPTFSIDPASRQNPQIQSSKQAIVAQAPIHTPPVGPGQAVTPNASKSQKDRKIPAAFSPALASLDDSYQLVE